MPLLDKQDVIEGLTQLGKLAFAEGLTLDLLLVGGAVMVLDLSARQATHDIDAVALFSTDSSTVSRLARQMAVAKAWPEDWLNDAAKGFIAGPTTPSVIFQAPGICVYRPAYGQLAAMKLCAWRDDVDINDARLLISQIPGTRDEVWNAITPHLLHGRELTAKYAFDELWEHRHEN